MLLALGCRPSTGLGDFCAAPPQGVVEADGEVLGGRCPLAGAPCLDDYLALPSRAPSGVLSRISNAELETMLDDVRAQVWPTAPPLENAELAEAAIDAANIHWLLEDYETRRLDVTVYERIDTPGARLRRWVMSDDVLGSIAGVTLLPDSDGPHPAVVVAPGHEQTAQGWIDTFGGRELADRGFAVIAVTFRVYDADRYEDAVTRQLLLNGLSFAGVRIVEQLLSLKYAAAMDEVDACRIGLVGHSGGSIIGNVTSRVGLGFVAYVTDLMGDYFQELEGGLLLDETSPSLHALHPDLNEIEDAHIPVLKVGYRYETEVSPTESEWPLVLEFLDAEVRDYLP